PPTDPTKIENAIEYAGTYQICPEPPPESAKGHSQSVGARTLAVVAEGEQLVLYYDDERLVLERRGPNRFYADHPNFSLFMLCFGHEDGEVVEVFHGPDWYINDRYSGATTFDYPPDWDAYPGHYCSHNPWLTNFRIILRKGSLTLVYPSGEEDALVPIEDGIFRVGEDPLSPERIRFDVILNNQSIRANISCGEYYRSFSF
ncbi:MAG: hypothetical protein KAS80_06880, partial [Anaerolineales bacterium]|nr:hypothetical protein [Anaerolineales bacterium]